MTRNNKNKIDRLLLSYYREEARSLKLPDSQRCWQDFQKLLEKENSDIIDTDISFPSADTVTLRGRICRFTVRYRNIAAAAAACFLIVMLLSGMPPVQMLRQALTGTLPEMQMVGPEDKAAEEFVLQTQPPQPLPPPLPSGEPEVFAEKAEEQISIIQGDGAVPALPANDALTQRVVPPGAGEGMEGLQPPAAAMEEVRESVFDSLQAYRTALREHASLAPGRLFYLAAPPAGYTFSGAAIYKTGASLLGVRQEFIDTRGDKLILQQDFAAPIPATIPPETDRAAAPQLPPPQETGEEASVYGIGGTKYTVSTENGRITLHYSLGNSVLMLTAALDKERLRHISAQLTVFEQ